MAPEHTLFDHHGKKADIWAAALVLVELLSKKYQFKY